MDVSVIIINYNTLEITKDAINSILEKTKEINYEIILVDNASVDGSVEYFENNYKGKILFIKNTENLGFGRANNKGIKIAKGKYVFLLNSDTLLINNAIKILYDFMEKSENIGVCGANLYDNLKKPIGSFAYKYPNIFSVCYRLKRKLYKKMTRKELEHNYNIYPIEVAFIVGADMLIKKELLNEVGTFDEDFFMYYEEIELQYRIKKHGYLIKNVPSAKIIHLEEQSSNKLNKETFKEKKYRMMLKSKYKYFYKIENLKTCKYSYYISQLGYFIKLTLTFNNNYLKMLKINKEEYKKFKEWKNGERN